ncbi:small integral membrane protein 19 isoform X2 [Microtus oregoni]|uniref:small integral membrane protein 19 isoform X2 n=1 Tax=Microtus oregoni TaxID=111838 RepID=UPI001BB2AC1E|nr:small integral membrane protein 19 isoform X2 [Microtus oregoni]
MSSFLWERVKVCERVPFRFRTSNPIVSQRTRSKSLPFTRNKRKIMRIFSVPPSEETLSEPNFYDTMSKIRLRQQLEMHSISRKYEYQQPQSQADSVQLSSE